MGALGIPLVRPVGELLVDPSPEGCHWYADAATDTDRWDLATANQFVRAAPAYADRLCGFRRTKEKSVVHVSDPTSEWRTHSACVVAYGLYETILVTFAFRCRWSQWMVRPFR